MDWQDKWQDGTYEKAATLELQERQARRVMRKDVVISGESWELHRLADLKRWLDQTRARFKAHGYEADARECERLLLEIRAIDPGFEEAT